MYCRLWSTSQAHSWIWLTTGNRSSAHLGKALATCKYQSFQTMKMRCVGQCAETVFCWWSLLMTSTEVCTGVCHRTPSYLHPTCQEENEAADKVSKLCLVLRVSPSVPALLTISECARSQQELMYRSSICITWIVSCKSLPDESSRGLIHAHWGCLKKETHEKISQDSSARKGLYVGRCWCMLVVSEAGVGDVMDANGSCACDAGTGFVAVQNLPEFWRMMTRRRVMKR